jgi:hypothetical protein
MGKIREVALPLRDAVQSGDRLQDEEHRKRSHPHHASRLHLDRDTMRKGESEPDEFHPLAALWPENLPLS